MKKKTGKMPAGLAAYWKAKRAGKQVTAKKKRHAKAVRKTNPSPLLFIITAKGTGKKMHFDGAKFSERSRVVTFATPDAAKKKALELLAKYPVLRKYRVAVEHNQHLPASAGRSPPK